MQSTTPLSPVRRRDVQQEFKLWSNTHIQIVDGPAQEGRDYVEDAMKLLPILEALSELHPIAKSVVSVFKIAVYYEHDRRENDARVHAVFIAQSEMMGALLDMDNLSVRRQERLYNDTNAKHGLHADLTLVQVLDQAAEEIGACTNTMDTYNGQKRFIKFWKAQDWRKRLMGHIAKFDEYRNHLHRILSIQAAADMGNFMNKMDTLLHRLFVAKADWEKEVASKRRQLVNSNKFKDLNDLINDTENFGSLVNLTKDPSLEPKKFGEERPSKDRAGLTGMIPTQLEQLKKDLGLPIDVLCERNREMFEMKLSYFAKQMQESINKSINDSANFVIKSLSGPHDRLHNEDLRILWKEMNWIFCVDNKLFTSALFEYYHDCFSSAQKISSKVILDVPGDHPDIVGKYASNDDANIQVVDEHTSSHAVNKVTFLSRLGAINHPDAWTLEPMSMYGDRISLSIDRDESGFIRISEANAFTARMPEGWTLPQWCAYAAIGWTYEARIYRKRIHNILWKMLELQAKVFPANKGFVAILIVDYIAPFFQMLAWEPREMTGRTNPIPPAQLRFMVHNKIKQADEVLRGKLQSFKWTIEDEASLRLLYGEEPLESYILQHSTLLLEHIYQVMEACTEATIDVKEISHFVKPAELLMNLCYSHVEELQDQLIKEKKGKEYLGNLGGGIWRFMIKEDEGSDDGSNSLNGDLHFEKLDIHDFGEDKGVLDEFPLPPLPNGSHTYLKYETWEQHVQSLSEENIPEEIPDSWHLDEQEIVGHDGSRHDWAAFPLSNRSCNYCGKDPIKEFSYICTICHDFDMCSVCYKLGQARTDVAVSSDHNVFHPVLRHALNVPAIQYNWFILDAQVQIDQVKDYVVYYTGIFRDNNDSSDESTEGDDSQGDEGPPIMPYSCSNCSNMIILDDSTAHYKCFGHSCTNYFLCSVCADQPIVAENSEGHQWWHSLIVLRLQFLLEGQHDRNIEYGNEPTLNESDRISELDATTSMLQDLAVQKAISEDGNDAELVGSESLDSRMSRLEDKVDILVSEMRNFFGTFSLPSM